MNLPELITVYTGDEPPRLKPSRYLDEWKPIDFFVTPLTVFKLFHINILDRGGKEIRVAAIAEGSAELRGVSFPPAHPQTGVVYERHDADPSRFVLPSKKDELQVSERLHAYSAGLAALGARTITVSVDQDSQANASVNLRVHGSAIRADVGPSTSAHSDTSCTLTLPGHGPRPLPSSPWLDTAEWRYLEETRRMDGLEKYTFTFTSSDKRSLNAEVAAEISSCGLTIGGEYKSLAHTEFRMTAQF